MMSISGKLKGRRRHLEHVVDARATPCLRSSVLVIRHRRLRDKREQIARPRPKDGELTMADVLTQHNNGARTGANLNETALTPDKLKQGKFGKLCFRLVDGNPYAQPLYASHVPIEGVGTRNVVIIATEHNTVFAFDADDTDQHSTTALLWKSDSLGPSVPSEVLSRDIARGDPAKCVDLTTEIGITSTPVISPDKTKMYVVAKTLDEPGHHYRFRLHVLKLADGKPAHAPVVIEGEADGAGKGSENGKITFDPKIQLNRPGLLLHDNVVYICFGSHCDKGTFHGWLFAYNATTLEKIDIFNTSPNTNGRDDGEAGIWQSGQGPAVDEESHVYFATGDGGNNKSTDFGNSVVKVKLESGKFKVKDSLYLGRAEQIGAFDPSRLSVRLLRREFGLLRA
jgi:hypothetical protein